MEDQCQESLGKKLAVFPVRAPVCSNTVNLVEKIETIIHVREALISGPPFLEDI